MTLMRMFFSTPAVKLSLIATAKVMFKLFAKVS
jgi:hypothetical protein